MKKNTVVSTHKKPYVKPKLEVAEFKFSERIAGSCINYITSVYDGVNISCVGTPTLTENYN
jgi:hypothetical protein